jgi:hypothetical protein
MQFHLYTPAPIPPGDKQRVEFLRSLNILDTKADISFDRITEAASTIMHSPIACVSLIDSNRQWIKSKVGMDVCETSRDLSFCSHVIAQSHNGMFVVCDAREDERFMYHDLVRGEPNIRFYAALPLVVGGGNGCKYKIGTLCIVDFKPRNLEENHQAVMEALAQLVVIEINKLRGLHNAHNTQFMQMANTDSLHSHDGSQPSQPAHHCNGEHPSLADIEASWKAIIVGHEIEPFPASRTGTNLVKFTSSQSSSAAASGLSSSFDSDADEELGLSSLDAEGSDLPWWHDGTPLTRPMDFD